MALDQKQKLNCFDFYFELYANRNKNQSVNKELEQQKYTLRSSNFGDSKVIFILLTEIVVMHMRFFIVDVWKLYF